MVMRAGAVMVTTRRVLLRGVVVLVPGLMFRLLGGMMRVAVAGGFVVVVHTFGVGAGR